MKKVTERYNVTLAYTEDKGRLKGHFIVDCYTVEITNGKRRIINRKIKVSKYE